MASGATPAKGIHRSTFTWFWRRPGRCERGCRHGDPAAVFGADINLHALLHAALESFRDEEKKALFIAGHREQAEPALAFHLFLGVAGKPKGEPVHPMDAAKGIHANHCQRRRPRHAFRIIEKEVLRPLLLGYVGRDAAHGIDAPG